MKSTISISPFRCRMWGFHDRLESHITEENCRAEIESFSRHGQMIPVLGRPLRGDRNYDVELIYGARRLFVARHLNTALLAEVRELTDREAIVAMDIENRLRQDISPYERGISYAQWLREGFFKSQEDIARALKVSPTRVSRLLKVARLPSVIVKAFETPRDIREEWGLDLVEALDDPVRREPTVKRARGIACAQTRPAPREIYQQLLCAEQTRRPRSRKLDEVVKDSNGVPIFRIRRQTNTMAILLPIESVSEMNLGKIRGALMDILQDRSHSLRKPARKDRSRRVMVGADAAQWHPDAQTSAASSG